MTAAAPGGGLPLDFYDAAPCGLLTTTGDGTVQRVNATLCRWLQRAPEAVVGARFQSLLTMGSKLFHQTHWMPLMQLQGSLAEVHLELVRTDGHVVPALVNAARRAVEQGEPEAGPPLGASGLVDIAVFVVQERRSYERELLAARRRAEELLDSERQAKDAQARAEASAQEALRQQSREAEARALLAEQLIGIVSHDLRNPLNTVLLGTQILGQVDLGDHARVVSRIASSAHRASRLITDLLDFTQARIGGGLRVQPKTIELHALVADYLEELKLAFPGRLIEHLRQGQGVGEGDADRLTQVVMNLTSNALTYGTPTEPVRVTSVVAEGSLEIHVHNDGPAIPVALRQDIFEPMKRGDQQLKGGSRSVGLGLYIVREIASAHRGAVTVRSEEGEGTTFSVRLPRHLALSR